MSRPLLCALLAVVVVGSVVRAEPPAEPAEPPCQPPIKLDPSIDDPHHTMKRAGYPQHVACYARPSETKAFVGYTVGGGCPLHRCGDYPCPLEGTWGWDYKGYCVPRRVFLYWWHKCDQGGVGAYKTDGPQLHCVTH